jgi:hypothetical protein
MALVGEVELARVLQRDRMAIRKAVTAGRITQRTDGLFDLDAAVEEFNANTNHAKGHNNRSDATASAKQEPVGDEPPEIPADMPTLSKQSTTYATARANREWYDAKLKRLRYEERAHSLTPTADVEAARFMEFRTLREACFQIPSRVAALLAGESDVARCQQMLNAELTSVFEAFADGTAA